MMPNVRPLTSNSGVYTIKTLHALERRKTLDEDNRAGILSPASDEVINHAANGDTDKHDNSPVEVLHTDRSLIGPEAPEEGVRRIQQACSVDRDAPFAERPAALGQQLGLSDAAVQDSPNTEHVSDHQSNYVERND
jgi:hypothetical protein